MATKPERRHQRVIGLQCECVALARELAQVSTVRKNAELGGRIKRIASYAREANLLCCTEWYSDELDRPAA